MIIPRIIAIKSPQMIICEICSGLRTGGGLYNKGTLAPVVEFTHSKNVAFRLSGRSASGSRVKSVLELLDGWLDASAAVLLYPSKDSANDEARYHWMTCSGKGHMLVLVLVEGVNAYMLLVLLSIEQFATKAAKTAETEELSPKRR